MRVQKVLLGFVITGVASATSGCKTRPASGVKDASESDEYAGYEGAGLSPVQERGRRIWYEACGDNGRFHIYTMAQRLGIPAAWGKVLSTATRDQRWSTWGMIPDPDCQPGNDQSYGFDICKGDTSDDGGVAPAGQGYEGLLGKVGKTGYKDPGCWISGTYNESDCTLGLGTSTGALGYRKYPNPRFDPNNWPGWDAYDQADGSIQPPFLIGTACGSCHISYNPLDPPKDPNHPLWRNIKGLVGNQWQQITEISSAGLDPHSIEWQLATNARIGTVDTSDIPSDLVFNPGTPNAIINLDRRPPGLPASPDPALKSFDKRVYDANGQLQTQRVFNILKGGEDDVGGAGAILRVYVNEGFCGEPCWLNHLLDFRSIDGRNSQQTPFDQAQCRRDCPAYRALEAHYPDVIQFFLAKVPGSPTDLKDALFPSDAPETRYQKLVTQLGPDKVTLGRQVYARECASCHSSQLPPAGMTKEDFFNGLAQQSDQTGVDQFLREENGERVDWLGNEERTPVTQVGTIRCRSLHSNHMKGHVWDEFSSETYKSSATPPGIPELRGIDGGGRGYMRNVSLLSVWTQAPFMHNNAVGPELCNNLHPNPPCVDKDKIPLADGTTVSNVTVAGRLKVFDDSMQAMLNPQTRGKKITRIDQDIVLPLGPQADVSLGADFHAIPFLGRLGPLVRLIGGSDLAKALEGATLTIPKGTPIALIASLDYRKLVKGIESDLSGASPLDRPKKFVALLNAIFRDPDKLVAMLEAGPANADPNVYSGYSNCTDVIEDKGHEFGASLSSAEKDGLIAFLKTL